MCGAIPGLVVSNTLRRESLPSMRMRGGGMGVGEGEWEKREGEQGLVSKRK